MAERYMGSVRVRDTNRQVSNVRFDFVEMALAWKSGIYARPYRKQELPEFSVLLVW